MEMRAGLTVLAILIGGLGASAWSADLMAEELETKIAQLAEEESWEEITAELEPWLRLGNSERWAHVHLGEALANLDRPAEAANHYDLALDMMSEAGEAKGKEYRGIRDELLKVDPLASRRIGLFNKIKRYYKDCAADLIKDGHDAQAMGLLERADWMMSPDNEEEMELRATLERLRVANEEVDLDASGTSERSDGDRPLIAYTSKRYILECNLEKDVAHAVGDTMDDIFMSYVQIYLNGDESRIPAAKATIRIHGDWSQMVKHYPGMKDPRELTGLGGWWSPSENKVTNFDTRDQSGSLDEMLGTLFHEASHQFMTALSMRGGHSPAWLNEGTASFFEGARAMQDHRVLWPDVAASRLRSLKYYLSGGPGGPTVEQVIGYDQPGSYPGEYYCFGWGLVYYLQEYEDPSTLAYVWRPYYQEYLQKITTEGGNPRKLFDEIFLRPGNPGGFTSFEDFSSSWSTWILETVAPMYSGNQPRHKRSQRAKKYMAAAEKAATRRTAGVTEDDILLRALRDLNFIRTQIDREDMPDGEIVLQEAKVLGRLGRDGAEASMIQLALDLSDDGMWDGLDDDGYSALTDRLGKINKTYRSLSLLRNRTRSLKKDAAKLLEEYLEMEGFELRGYTFAARAGGTLRDPFLSSESNRLRSMIGDGGLVGDVRPLDGKKWESIYSGDPKDFSHSETELSIETVAGAHGKVCTDIEVGGKYEIRGTLKRQGELDEDGAHPLGRIHGIVVAGTADGDWTVVGIDKDGDVVVMNCIFDGRTVNSTDIDVDYGLDEPLAVGHNPKIIVRVDPEGSLEVFIDDQEVVEIELPYEMPRVAHPGIFAKTGRTTLEDMVIETYP
ncbi:MAG: tetratricopeptide (TPR) repeat protein [Bacteroidia bacterium]|jgi:tetratricopeptide (TPR) repeat protein